MLTYCKIYNVPWEEPMSHGLLAYSPVVLEGPHRNGPIDVPGLMRELKRASTPYIPSLIKKIKALSGQ